MDDWQTLRNYVDHNSEEAFAALMARYVGLVYSVCRRELADDQAAEDVTQAVFLLLARKAHTLRRGVILSGWLFQTARFAAKNARLQAQRRWAYEQKAAEEMLSQTETEDAAWADIEPVLNQSLAALRAADRDCILLRFFQGLSFVEVGIALGLSEEVARKRVTRALEKMRQFFGKNGVIVPGATLAVVLSAHAAKAAPAHLSDAAAHILAGSVPSSISLITEGVLHAMKIFKLKAVTGVAAFAIVGVVTYTVVHAVPPEPVAADTISLRTPVNAEKNGSTVGAKKSSVLNVSFVGKVRYADGRPAGAVAVWAQMQEKAYEATFASPNGIAKRVSTATYKFVQAESRNYTVSEADGSYELPLGADVPYNIMVDDTTGKWVAAGIEGVQGHKNGIVNVPDLILTPGALLIGTVKDKSGLPVAGVSVGNYGPHQPKSSAGCSSAITNAAGQYRLRVAPGSNRIYVMDENRGDTEQNVNVESGTITTVNLGVTR